MNTFLLMSLLALPLDPNIPVEPNQMDNIQVTHKSITNNNTFPVKCYLGLKAGLVYTEGYVLDPSETLKFNPTILKFSHCKESSL